MEREPDSLNDVVRPNLSKYEIAAVTVGVPATGDPLLDKIITIGQRAHMATEILPHLRAQIGETSNYDANALAVEALSLADALLKALRG